VLAADKKVFLDFTSGDSEKIKTALAHLEALPLGHFEDHPLSRKLVLSGFDALVALWNSDVAPVGCRRWIAQLVADARIAATGVKPIVQQALGDRSCSYLPTLLYLIGSNPESFEGIGESLLPLASHPDREVRWRVAWAISKMKQRDSHMMQAIKILARDPDSTTKVYVRECGA